MLAYHWLAFSLNGKERIMLLRQMQVQEMCVRKILGALAAFEAMGRIVVALVCEYRVEGLVALWYVALDIVPEHVCVCVCACG